MQKLQLVTPIGWQDYELLDSGEGEKLERFGEFILVRPDPQILWSKSRPAQDWDQAHAAFIRTHQDRGQWQVRGRLPDEWSMHWGDVTALVKLSPFKHTGVFPEQSAHWQWFRTILEQARTTRPEYQPQVLNLFGYTGLASMVGAKTGAMVTHVDASRAAIGWAKKNQAASGLDERSIRWILDDVMKFVTREVKRGKKYDAIIMDPPVYGHGPTGEVWDFKTSLPQLLTLCQQLLTDRPLFVLINAYAVSTSAVTLGNVLTEMMAGKEGQTEIGELALQQVHEQRLLSTGIWARWQGQP